MSDYNINDGKKEARRAVTCFILSKDRKILIERRSEARELHPGEIDLCSGHVEEGELDYMTMIRELDEELGISRQQSAGNLLSLGCMNLDFNNRGKIIRFLGHIYMLKLPQNSEDIEISIDESELSSFEWLPMEEVFDLIRAGKTKFPYTQNSKGFEKIFSYIASSYGTKKAEYSL